MVVSAGHPLHGGEQTVRSLRARWPTLLLFTALSAGLVAGIGAWLAGHRGSGTDADSPTGSFSTTPVVWGLAGLWVMLSFHNLGLLPRVIGFDAPDHLAYVHYIQQRHALPLAHEGPLMYNPPLYYLLAAALLDTLSLATTDWAGVTALRLLQLVIGISHLFLAAASLRLIFPKSPGAQLAGLLLAGLLPMHLYLSQYVTNETLLATLVTATLYQCLRILQAERPSLWIHAGLGLCLGAALLTKFTAFLLAPFVVGALVWKLVAARERRIQTWLGTLGVMALTCVSVCGWHYLRVWLHFGKPLVAGWEPIAGHNYWQDEGYRTSAYFWRAGQALVSPLFSGFNGLTDAIYSTLWGDGWCGGTTALDYRAPWNYDLVAVGYLLALTPTALILAGAVRSVGRFLREPTAPWFVLIGLVCAFGLAFVKITLEVPSYGMMKAFYGLLTLLPICAFAGAGWDWLARPGRIVRLALSVALGLWAINSYASVWIRSRAAATQTLLGDSLAGEGRHAEGAQRFVAALQLDPRNVHANSALAASLDQLGQAAESLRLTEQNVNEHPGNARCHINMAMSLSERRELERAIGHAQRAVELAPVSAEAHWTLATRLALAGRFAEAATACRAGLGIVPANPEIHLTLGSTLAQQAKVAASTNSPAAEAMVIEGLQHFRLATLIRPDWPEALNNLAWLLATHPNPKLRDGAEAVRLAERACQLSGYQRIPMLNTLAMAYAEAGRFADALGQARKSLALAETAGDQRLVERSRRMIEAFEAGRVIQE
jgi:tetratricopeptide (TPR) repeat protein